MGLSISASAAIIFIASVIVFGALLGAFDSSQHSVLDAQRAAQTRAIGESNTHITIQSLNEINGTLTILNDGDVTLNLDEIDLFLNGILANDQVTTRAIEGVGPTALWMPGEVLVLSIDGVTTNDAVKVVCGNGASTYY